MSLNEHSLPLLRIFCSLAVVSLLLYKNLNKIFGSFFIPFLLSSSLSPFLSLFFAFPFFSFPQENSVHHGGKCFLSSNNFIQDLIFPRFNSLEQRKKHCPFKLLCHDMRSIFKLAIFIREIRDRDLGFPPPELTILIFWGVNKDMIHQVSSWCTMSSDKSFPKKCSIGTLVFNK